MMADRLAWCLVAAAFALALALGYWWHGRYENHVLAARYRDGYDDGLQDGRDETAEWIMGQILDAEAAGPVIPGDAEVTAEFLAAPLEPGHYRMYDERLAPEVLDAAGTGEFPLGETIRDGMPGSRGLAMPAGGRSPESGSLSPRPDGETLARATAREAPSPYSRGGLTPAQRRRDKHKQRGEYAAAALGHWYADGLHYIADWQAEWHAEAAAVDEQIARWTAGAREQLVPAWTRAAQILERA